MTPKELAAQRKTWIVTKDGKFSEASAALVRTPAELPVEITYRSHGTTWAALTPEQAADPTWDAVPCEWQDMPHAVMAARGVARLEGRSLVAHGLRFHFDDRGRPLPGRKTPGPPDPEIVDQAALQAFAEQSGRPIEVTERGTLRKATVLPAAQAR